MTAPGVLREPTFADLITAIRQASELQEQTRRQWVCSVRRIAKCLDRPVEEIPARWTALRASVGDLHHARVGIAAKTLANHKANLRAALRWRAKEYPLPRNCLSPDWAAFRDRVDDPYSRLFSLMRYCAARRIGPGSVNDQVVDEYWRYRSRPPHWLRTIAPDAGWRGRGTHAQRVRSRGRGRSPSRPSSQRLFHPGSSSPRAFARMLMPTSPG